jgi:hypothetical protein
MYKVISTFKYFFKLEKLLINKIQLAINLNWKQ